MEILFFVILCIAYPLYSWLTQDGYERKLAAGETSRRAWYLETMVWLWGFTVVALALHFWRGRSAEELFLVVPSLDGGRFVGGAIVAFAIVAALLFFELRLVRGVGRTPDDEIQKLRTELDSVRSIMPGTPAERRFYDATSFTAGVTEEILFRGWVVWFLAQWMPMWGAVLVSAVLFGVAHIYQNPKMALRAAGFGLLCSFLVLLSGSLLPAVIFHFLHDVIQARLVRRVLDRLDRPDAGLDLESAATA